MESYKEENEVLKRGTFIKWRWFWIFYTRWKIPISWVCKDTTFRENEGMLTVKD